MNYLANLFGLGDNGLYSPLAVLLVRENWLPLLLGLIFCTPVARKTTNLIRNEKAWLFRYPAAAVYPIVLAGLFILSLVYLLRGVRIPYVL